MKDYHGSKDEKLSTTELKLTDTSTLELNVKLIQSAFYKAKNGYQTESIFPYTESKLGIPFNLTSWFDYKKTPKEMKEIEIVLTSNKRGEEIIKQLANVLTEYGSLWDSSSYEFLFNNYFLLCLRRQDINAYRKIIGQAYGICFAVGTIELYRTDSRKPEVLFKDGFQLKITENQNQPGTRKCFYANLWNDSCGISFSKKYPSYVESQNYYKVILPKNHQFLLIDIVNSPRNKAHLDSHQYEKELAEVNSLDNIPSKYIQSCRLWRGSKECNNKSFSSSLESTIEEMPPRGCY